MSKQKGLVPPLRFPEFRNAGPWEVKRLGDKSIAKFIRDRIPSEEIPIGHYVSTVNLLPDFGGLATEPETPPPNNAIAYRESDILMSNIRPYLKKVWIADRFGGASNDVLVIRAGKGIKGAYLGHLLMSDRFITYVMGGAKGVKMPRGDLEQIKNFQVPVPPTFNEQQKIADCLSSLDDLIRAEGERLEALKEHKKGLMQRLFPVEGQTTPELRFPEFRNAGPWEVKRLDKLVKTVTPPKKLQASEYLPNGKYPVIDQSPNDICGWTNDKTALLQGDFPLVIFGDHTCTIKLACEPFAQGADGIKILAPTPEIEARFLFLALQANPIEQKGYKRHFSTLKEKLIPFPHKDTGEQQKIADCLSSLDELIQAKSKRIDVLKLHKKGLMQQLFPSLDKVWG